MKIYRQKELVEMLGVSATTIWRWQKSGIFPQRIKVGPNTIGWRADDVEDWVQSRREPTDSEAK